MLVITRKSGESIFVGDEIKITLQGIRGNQVRIGIDAPSHVRIYREEIYQQIVEENKSAAGTIFDTPDGLESIASKWKSKKLSTLSKLKTKEPEDEDQT